MRNSRCDSVSKLLGDAFENIGEAVGDCIQQFDKHGAAAQRFTVGCQFAVDESGVNAVSSSNAP